MKQTTTLLIRPAARGGKYLGADAANAHHHSAAAFLLDPAAERVAAFGLTEAATPQSAGPADLMAPVSRCAPFAADGDTVGVRLSVDIAEPTVFRLLAVGPLSHPDQARVVQADITLLPGVDIGIGPQYPEGLVVEIPGLCISAVAAQWQGAQLSCRAKVTMMCGCPIRRQSGWFWPAGDFSVRLVTCTQRGAVYSYPLAFDDSQPLGSSFQGQWDNQAPGDPVAQAWVYASEPKLGNQGCYRILPALPLPPLRLPRDAQRVLREADITGNARACAER
ncbi:hypothetical protein [Methylogaea oryzae]|nr:hypothetical protein [Methylogaea oryzae]